MKELLLGCSNNSYPASIVQVSFRAVDFRPNVCLNCFITGCQTGETMYRRSFGKAIFTKLL